VTNKEKNAFRRTKAWKEFVKRELKARGLRCELTGVKLTARTAQLHHLRPDSYDLLSPPLFKLLSPTAHNLVEFLALVIHGNTTKVPRREALMAWIGEFLPEPEHTARDLMDQLRRTKDEPS